MIKRKRPTHFDVIQEIYRDSDGWWIYLKPGWRNGNDPMGCEHAIHEDTKREAMALVSSVLPCDCKDCQQQPGYVKRS